MTRAEPLLPHDGTPSAANDEAQHPQPVQCLRDSVTAAVRHYLKELDGHMSTDVYQMVLHEMEPPLLQAVLQRTNFNRCKAATLLGISRTAFCKKLQQYQLDLWIIRQKMVALPRY